MTLNEFLLFPPSFCSPSLCLGEGAGFGGCSLARGAGEQSRGLCPALPALGMAPARCASVLSSLSCFSPIIALHLAGQAPCPVARGTVVNENKI